MKEQVWCKIPKMKQYLSTNGPWSQLVVLDNIKIRALKNDSTIYLNTRLKVTPILVPHRDEYAETVGYKIEGKHKTALFIPDIDKWQKWDRNIIEEVKKVDYAFVDASFFRDGELKRDMSKIPHPFKNYNNWRYNCSVGQIIQLVDRVYNTINQILINSPNIIWNRFLCLA